MQTKVKTISAGLAFLQAAAAAIPRTLGDRARIAAMSESMHIAVKSRFAFDKDDVPALQRLGIQTCVGVFRPMDYYLLACAAGGTYARMWEAHRKQKPWIASKAVFPNYVLERQAGRTTLENNRVTAFVAVLLPSTFSPEEEDLASFERSQVWWCTSHDNDSITLCRYRVTELAKERGAYHEPFSRCGSPARIRKLSREEWATWNDLVDAAPQKLAA
jgi:hypothetical protein